MARIRSIKPEFFRSRKLSERSLRARLTFIGLWTACDDEGRYRYEPELLKADLWPFEADVTPTAVDADVRDLAACSLICLYEAAGKRYLHVVNWHEHQKINRPTPSKLPACSRSTHGGLSEGSGPEKEVEREREREREAEEEPLVGDEATDEEIIDAEVLDDSEQPDARKLCEQLADEIQANTGKRPSIGKRWLDAARLMLTRDGLTVEQVEYLIRWSQADEFWRSNILSMPKLRKHQQTLILRIKGQQNGHRLTDQERRHRASLEELLA